MTNTKKDILSKLGGQTNFYKSDAESIICLLFFLPPVDLVHGKVCHCCISVICASSCHACAELYMRDSGIREPSLIHHGDHRN